MLFFSPAASKLKQKNLLLCDKDVTWDHWAKHCKNCQVFARLIGVSGSCPIKNVFILSTSNKYPIKYISMQILKSIITMNSEINFIFLQDLSISKYSYLGPGKNFLHA